MATDVVRRDRNRAPAPTHPGAILCEDVLPAAGKTKVEIASMLGVSRQTLYDILPEKQAVTPAIAVRLGKLFGNGPGIGCACSRLAIYGMLSARSISQASRL